MDKSSRTTIALIAAAAICIVLPFLRLHPLIALLFGVATFFLIRDVLPRSPEGSKNDGKIFTDIDVEAVDASSAREVLLEKGNKVAERFESLARDIAKSDVAENVRRIADLVRQLFKNFTEDPDDLNLPASQTFLQTNLERSLRLVEGYVRISGLAIKAENENSIRDAEEAISLTRQGFEALLVQCQENDLRQLDMDSHVLTRMIESRFPHLITENAKTRETDEEDD